MCLVIDTCCLSAVFDGQSRDHAKFVPVLEWVSGKGRMIYGGTKYNEELKKARKFLPYITELSKQRKAIQMPSEGVDRIAAELKRKAPEPKFDDEHLVALVIASRCRVICTNDKKAAAYLKRADLFADYAGVDRPKIFNGHRSHGNLCCDSNIVGACRE